MVLDLVLGFFLQLFRNLNDQAITWHNLFQLENFVGSRKSSSKWCTKKHDFISFSLTSLISSAGHFCLFSVRKSGPLSHCGIFSSSLTVFPLVAISAILIFEAIFFQLAVFVFFWSVFLAGAFLFHDFCDFNHFLPRRGGFCLWSLWFHSSYDSSLRMRKLMGGGPRVFRQLRKFWIKSCSQTCGGSIALNCSRKIV